MKTISAIFGLAFLTNITTTQTLQLTLSDEQPKAGEKISISFTPAGSVVENDKNISAVVFQLSE